MYATGTGSQGCPTGSLLTGPIAVLLRVAEPAAFYRPRHPERQSIYQVFEQHFDAYRFAHEERFEPSDGPLRQVVVSTVEAYLACGRPEGGFARLRCDACGGEHLLAFSCRSRNFCGSCQAKRAALFAEKLVEDILAEVPHRHAVFTIPRALRALFRRERRLLGLLSRSAYEAVRLCLCQLFARNDVRPGFVASLQTFGSFVANWNPHVHCLISEGAFTPQGEILSVPAFDTDALEQLFRAVLLRALHQAERLSDSFLERLLSWSPSGFSVHAEQRIPPHDTQQLEHLARYIARPPIRLDSVELLDDGRLGVTTPPDPRNGQTRQVLDPLDFIHALTTQIPDFGQHLYRYYGAYSCRSHTAPRPARSPDGDPAATDDLHQPDTEADDAFLQARRRSWARLLKRIFEVDPFLCPCGGQLHIVSVISETHVIDRILRHLRDPATPAFDPFELQPSRAPLSSRRPRSVCFNPIDLSRLPLTPRPCPSTCSHHTIRLPASPSTPAWRHNLTRLSPTRPTFFHETQVTIAYPFL